MLLSWGSRWSTFWRNGRNLRIGWIFSAIIIALYLGVFRPPEQQYGINNSRATGLAAFSERPQPLAIWHRSRVAGIISGIPNRVDADKMVTSASLVGPPPQAPSNTADAKADRKMVRTAAVEMLVQRPAETAEKIRLLAEQEGGFLVNSEVRGDQYAAGATLTVRVPAERFEAVRDEIRKLGLRIENERIEAQDVTRQYADQEANLRNLRAEEQQYLLILKQSRTVKDTLEVSEKISEVRGQIEQQQAEFNALSKQIETVAITLELRAEAEARVLGLNWRPLYQIKAGFRDGLEGLANYFSAITAFLFLLPTILLWVATLGAGGVVTWRMLRWIGRRWFEWGGVPHSAETAAN